MARFIYKYTNEDQDIEICMGHDGHLSLSEVLENYTGFLKAVGFHFEGREIDVIDVDN